MTGNKNVMDDKHKSLDELIEVIAYRIWLTKMGLHETYDILLAGSDFIYG